MHLNYIILVDLELNLNLLENIYLNYAFKYTHESLIIVDNMSMNH